MVKFYQNSKGQASFEYISMVAIVILFVVTGTGIIYNYSQRSSQDISLSTIQKIGNDLIDVSEKIYYVGGTSWETVRFNLPDSVKKMYVQNNYVLVIEYESNGGLSQAVFFSDINLTTPYMVDGLGNLSSNFHPGVNSIRLTSNGNSVLIEEKV